MLVEVRVRQPLLANYCFDYDVCTTDLVSQTRESEIPAVEVLVVVVEVLVMVVVEVEVCYGRKSSTQILSRIQKSCLRMLLLWLMSNVMALWH